MVFKSFMDINAWKESRVLVKEIYLMCNQGECKNDFGFRSQIQRASVSIMSNIAEGFGAGSDKGFCAFLSYAFRSALEVESQLYVAMDIGYTDSAKGEELINLSKSIQRMISGLMNYLKPNCPGH